MRKLATAALAFSAAIFLANYILPEGRLIVPAVLSAALGAALFLLRRKWLRGAVIALLFFALGLAEYGVYARLTVDRAAEYAGQTREIRGTVIAYPDDYGDYCRLRIRVTSPELPRFKAIVYDNGKRFAEAEPGQTVSFSGKISTADTLYGKPYDNYLVDRFFWRISIKGGEELSDGGFYPAGLPVRLRRYLCARADEIFPAGCRAFIKALMLGDKTDLYEDDALYVAMTRAGLMHVAAVSGLHIAFLVGLVGFLLGRGRRGALTGIVLIWCFALLTGGRESVIRAAFMQTLLLMAPILRRENDPITALSAALMLILAACPFAAKSVGLQLSFAAMAGIIFFSEKIYRWLMRPLPKRLRVKPVAYVLGIIACTLGVMVFTTPLTALHFSYVPLLSLVSNLACIWAVSLCFCFAWAACLLAWVPVLGTVLAGVATLLARYVLFCAGLVSSLPYAVLYMKARGALAWMLGSYALLILGLLLRRRRWLRALLPLGLSLGALVFILRGTAGYYREHDCFSVLDVGQGQCIAAFAGDDTAVIDCGNISTLDDAGSIAGEYLLGCGRRGVGLLILTHLHADHADGAVRLMELLPVDTLVLPADTDDGDNLRGEILECAAKHGTHIVELAEDAELSCGRIRARLYKLAGKGTENERCLMVRLSIGETDMLVTADAPKSMERALVKREDLSGTEILIAGHHGSKKACAPELLEEAGGRLAIISVGYNTYGHPAPETLEALEKYGYTVRRTDVDGTVEFRPEGNDG